MNTVSQETRDADERFRDIWGKGFDGKSHLMVTADSVSALQDLSDQLSDKISAVETDGVPASGVTLSMIFPGNAQKKENYQAWTRFWTSERVRLLKQSLIREGEPFGFTRDAFDPFLNRLIKADIPHGPVVIPKSLYPMMGISQSKTDGESHSPWIWTLDLVRNPAVDSHSL